MRKYALHKNYKIICFHNNTIQIYIDPVKLVLAPRNRLGYSVFTRKIKAHDEQMEQNSESLSARELTDTKAVIAVLIAAFRSYGFYPDNHASTLKIIENVKKNFESYLEEYGELRFYIEKDRLLYKGEIVHYGSASDDNIAFILYRDGIQWIEFQKGLELREISDFVKTVKQHWALLDDPEDDIVTELYELDMPHLRYEASDDLWSSVSPIDFFQLNADEPGTLTLDKAEINHHQLEDREGETGDKKNCRFFEPAPPSVTSISMDRSKWDLSPEEINAIRLMLFEENNRDWAADISELLIIVLQREDEKENISEILEYLKEEFKDLLKFQEFHRARELLKKISECYRFCRTEKKWCVSFLNDFFKKIHSEQVLHTLLPTLQKIGNLDKNTSKRLQTLLQSLQSSAIYALAPMVSLIDSEKDRQFLLNIIADLAKKNLRPVQQLIGGEDETLVLHLVSVLEELDGQWPLDLLLNKLISHKAARIRCESLKIIMRKNCKEYAKLFPLLDDPDETVRARFLYYIAREKNASIEDHLREYLEKEKYILKTREHILACYKTLGQCGSGSSEPFLVKSLMAGSGKSFFSVSPSIHQIGAAFALNYLNTENSKKTIEKASKSLNPGIRLACRRAMKEQNV